MPGNGLWPMGLCGAMERGARPCGHNLTAPQVMQAPRVCGRMGDAVLAALGAAAPFLRPGERERLAAQTRPFDPRSECFVPHPREEFVRGRVMARQGGEATVQTELGEVGNWGIGVAEGTGARGHVGQRINGGEGVMEGRVDDWWGKEGGWAS